jgi:electron transfer flavoprotein alpha subunit
VADALAVVWPGSGLEGGSLARTGLELVGVARTAAGDGGAVTLVVLGPGAEAVAGAATGLGVTEVALVDADLDVIGAEAYLAVLADLMRARAGATVVLPGDVRGRDLAARLAARADGCAINDVVGLSVGDDLVWTRPCFGGKALAEIVARRAPTVVTVRPRAFEPAEPGPGEAPPVTALELPAVEPAVRSLGTTTEAVAGVRLEDAKLVVAGGRGLGSKESFERLEQLAALLGGSVGASLAAVDEGWAGPHQQVGLSGKVVGPETYIAIGISGASQHIAGLAAVKTLVAINNDPSAPIFGYANLGAVVDAGEAVPGLIAELRRLAGG